MRADHHHGAGLVAKSLNGRQAFICSKNCLIEQDRMQRLCARLIPERRAWRLVQPNRIAAEERFPERNNARARIERGLDMSDGGFGAGAES